MEYMMRRFLFAFLMAMLIAAPLSAQRRTTTYQTHQPDTWLTFGVGEFTATGVNDGRTGSNWDFGNSTNFHTQYRASLEKGLANGSAFGVSGSWGHVPFVYSSDAAVPLPPNATGARCFTPCNAHLDMMTLLATLHIGTGLGFHQVIELNGGIVAYRNLKTDADHVKLAPAGGNIDPLFSFGYGLGYGFGPRAQMDFVPDYEIAIHERSGLSNSQSNTNSIRSLKVTLRMAF
jgi:hypothetical protein